MPSLSEFLTHAVQQLRTAGIENAATEARLLTAALLGCDRAQLLTQGERALTSAETASLQTALSRRAAHEPLARLVGRKEFWSLDFGLNDATLVPRPDSETLISTALDLFPDKQAPLRILDLGTGSGCLLLALLHEYPNATGLGVDMAPAAVTQATLNAERLGLLQRAKFVAADWNAPDFAACHGIPPFDLIVSNPPYVASAIIPTLDAEVRSYDPLLALDGGVDGLTAYRQLAALLPALRHAATVALLEIGYDQAESVPPLFQNTATRCTLARDLAQQARCVIIHPHKSMEIA